MKKMIQYKWKIIYELKSPNFPNMPKEATPKKTFETLQAGDLVRDKDGDYLAVLAVIAPGVYAMSEYADDVSSDELKRGDSIRTAYEMGVRDWKIVGEDDIEELTLEEAARRLGKNVKIIV